MGATNTTSHYNLSQFISTDKPAWLQDYNGDMLKIDTAIDAAKVAADTAQTTANAASGASTQNASDIAALSTDVSGQGANITALQLAVNTINSLIGNGTPTTTDQTIIGAINEINALLTGLNTKFNKNWDELLTITGNQTGVTVSDLSAYRYIGIALQAGSGTLINTSIIPYALFTTHGIQCDFYDTNRHYAVAQYVGNTSVTVQHDGSNVVGKLFGIY